jgi:hypothetical protein
MDRQRIQQLVSEDDTGDSVRQIGPRVGEPHCVSPEDLALCGPRDPRDRFSQALRSALQACQRLESDEKLEGSIHFDRQNVRLFVNDRMLAPNTGHPTDSVQAEIRNFFERALGHQEFEMKFESKPRSLFGVEVHAAKPLELDKVLARLN